MNQNKKASIFYFSITAVSLIYFLSAIELPFGTFSKPMQGFYPIILSVIAIALSAYNGVTLLLKKAKETDEQEEPGVEFTGRKDVLKFFAYIGVIIFFIVFSGIIGAYTCLFLLVFALSKIQGLQGIWKPLLLAAGTAVCFYLLFGVVLEVVLPTGFLI
ncbi:tripartite tricarboxylate transporter TctB family protein [Caproiciproducens faecalis]|uniref:Tripartite tricarboxylate transporter TctB family protein n=1 Tax=Caproiciproducens faecalis TaxID=2820301 RepID=A0ABS7DRK5_9FIRM|nr:tripartite tricarboxylate transporter TctB family protein [Caproiciproducens faecalis]MBW7573211.1 tripartite tricarboxylate transporter TctB family protein [Caproiciproducens faecalis]